MGLTFGIPPQCHPGFPTGYGDEHPRRASQNHSVLVSSWAFPLLITVGWMSSAGTWTTLAVSPLACRNQLHITGDNSGM